MIMIEQEGIRKRVVEMLDRGKTAGLEDRERAEILREVDRIWTSFSRIPRRPFRHSDDFRSIA
jgi:hypothetical protein